MNKKKIFNDPVYGFITIPDNLIFDIIEHPYFQRLRRIKQLGLTDLVYPGALHTRFHHAIGAMHLMKVTLDNLRSKGIEISDEEYRGSMIAILLHDIGHGPFSHTLENSLLTNVNHERISLILMHALNREFGGELDLTIKIFENSYERKFFNDLVSSQLDIDRLDYLKRDSFFTGVMEGTIGADRIIKMMYVHEDRIVVEEKGIYSIENFLNARRLMYWQVYLHKTAVSAESMLLQLIRRARALLAEGQDLYCPDSLKVFLSNSVLRESLQQKEILDAYCRIDDTDIWTCIKSWQFHEDRILSYLSEMLLNRRLFKINLSNKPPKEKKYQKLEAAIMQQYGLDETEVSYYLNHGMLSNAAYLNKESRISILSKTGKLKDVAEASDLPNIKAMSKIVKKYYLCWPKNVSL